MPKEGTNYNQRQAELSQYYKDQTAKLIEEKQKQLLDQWERGEITEEQYIQKYDKLINMFK